MRSHESRCELVACLCERQGTAPVTVLAGRLATVEDRSLAESIRSLLDTHLPLLERHGVVEHDPDEGVVTLCADPDRIADELPDSR